MRRTASGRFDTTGLLPIVLGLLVLVLSVWHLVVERSAEVEPAWTASARRRPSPPPGGRASLGASA